MLKIRIAKYLMAIAVMVASVTSCVTDSSKPGKAKVVVGIMPVYEVAKAIAGDSIDVVCLMPKGGNPETYEPTISQYVEVEQSEAFMYVNGMGFEASIASRIKENNGELMLVDLSKGIDLLYGTHGNCSHHHHHKDGACGHDDVDPHVWSSAKNMSKIAYNILQTLKTIDSAHATYYEENYDSVATLINRVDAELDSLLAPCRGEAFVVWHPSLGYFARDYGLEQISVGGQESKESSVNQLCAKIETAMSHGARIMVLQKNYDDRQAQVVNEQIDACVVEIDPLDADWAKQLKTVAYEIASKRND